MNSNHLVLGILADVDAGKTTLSENILYVTGSIRKLGRVDHKDTCLDTDQMERERGITIFSKQAEFSLEDRNFTLLDTPGHADFSAETERVLSVLDYAILVISAPEGLRSHVITLWKLLKRYRIPTFLFINKTDLPSRGKDEILGELSERFGEGFLKEEELLQEETALLDEELTDKVLKTGEIRKEDIRKLILERKLFPCVFGSALKNVGIDRLLTCLSDYTEKKTYPEEFGALVYKITREKGIRYTHLKITGGKLAVKDLIGEEKAEQIHLFSGEHDRALPEAEAGSIVSVTGLGKTSAGMGLGNQPDAELPELVPLFSMTVLSTFDISGMRLFEILKELEEEIPELSVDPYSGKGDVRIRLMGAVQSEVIARILKDRYQITVSFGSNRIVYRETVTGTSEGVGHFEPLRHYAEVHLLLQPAERGTGLQFDSELSEDLLPGNYQRLILSQLEARVHRGVLTGSVLTDVHASLIAGKHHVKHTVGGDFREAACRALRQGLMKNENKLLEPWYSFEITLPQNYSGRLMNDLGNHLSAVFEGPEAAGENAVFRGRAPVSLIQNYQAELTAYTRGFGKMTLAYAGYFDCHNPEEVIAGEAYDPEADLRNPCGSVFCGHGAGFYVPWNEVEEYMHLPLGGSRRPETDQPLSSAEKSMAAGAQRCDLGAGSSGEFQRNAENNLKNVPDGYAKEKELEAYFNSSLPKNRKEEKSASQQRGKKAMPVHASVLPETCPIQEPKKKFLLVDGYNIIHAWKELAELAETDFGGARTALLDILSNYQGFWGHTLIVVFDAYKVPGGKGSIEKYHNVYVVFTKEAETADAYIEKTVHEIGRKSDVTVATSDALEQVIIFGSGAVRMSAAELYETIKSSNSRIHDFLDRLRPREKNLIRF